MLAITRRLISDFIGLRRVCGLWFATRWLAQVARHFPSCLKRRDLQPADLAFGRGPVHAQFGDAQAQLLGNCVVTGVREIWVRDCYLGGGFLSIPDGSTVVDLGANIGVFTMLALAHGPNVRAIAVEPNHDAARYLADAARLNGLQDRLQICHAFLGGRTSTQDALAAMPDYAGAEFMNEDQFIERYDLTRIDFLKCDIEGSEFQLLTPDSSKLLAITRQLSIELHNAMGDSRAFTDMLRSLGFDLVVRRTSSHDCVINARRHS
jgi:FkbM family methyltransferase